MKPRSFKMTYNFLVFPVRTLIFCLQLFNFFSLVTFPLSSSALVFWFLYINTMIDVTFFIALNIFPFTAYNCWKLILFSAFDWKNPSTRLFSLSNFSLLIFSLLLTCLLKWRGTNSLLRWSTTSAWAWVSSQYLKATKGVVVIHPGKKWVIS